MPSPLNILTMNTKRILVTAAVVLSAVEMYRTGSATALALSMVLAYILCGRDIYRLWLRMITPKNEH